MKDLKVIPLCDFFRLVLPLHHDWIECLQEYVKMQNLRVQLLWHWLKSHMIRINHCIACLSIRLANLDIAWSMNKMDFDQGNKLSHHKYLIQARNCHLTQQMVDIDKEWNLPLNWDRMNQRWEGHWSKECNRPSNWWGS